MLNNSRQSPGQWLSTQLSRRRVSLRTLADAIGSAPSSVARLVNDETALTPEMAVRLSKALGVSARLLMNLRLEHELALAQSRVDLSSVRSLGPMPVDEPPRSEACDQGICIIGFIPRPEQLPAEPALTLIDPSALVRARGFANARRRVDFLWGRVMVRALLNTVNPMAKMVERAPLSPLIDTGKEQPLYCTISHTRTFIGAALSTSPVAIDLEIIDPKRHIEAIFTRLFGLALWRRIPPQQRIERFFEFWGQHECAVKLQAQLEVLDAGPRLTGNSGAPVQTYHRRLAHETLLTIALEGPHIAPAIRGLTAGEVLKLAGA